MQKKESEQTKKMTEEEQKVVRLMWDTLQELSFLYNKTGRIEKGKVFGTMTDGGADLISFFEKKLEAWDYNKLIEMRYNIWIEYTQLIFDKLKENIDNIIGRFGKVKPYYSNYKDMEKGLNGLSAESKIGKNIAPVKKLFSEMSTLNEEIEKQIPIIINDGNAEYFTKRFLPMEAIFSAVYIGILGVASLTPDFVKMFGGKFEIIHLAILVVIWFVLSCLLNYGGKIILKPRL